MVLVQGPARSKRSSLARGYANTYVKRKGGLMNTGVTSKQAPFEESFPACSVVGPANPLTYWRSSRAVDLRHMTEVKVRKEVRKP